MRRALLLLIVAGLLTGCYNTAVVPARQIAEAERLCSANDSLVAIRASGSTGENTEAHCRNGAMFYVKQAPEVTQ